MTKYSIEPDDKNEIKRIMNKYSDKSHLIADGMVEINESLALNISMDIEMISMLNDRDDSEMKDMEFKRR